jgi:hypothetical protein
MFIPINRDLIKIPIYGYCLIKELFLYLKKNYYLKLLFDKIAIR